MIFSDIDHEDPEPVTVTVKEWERKTAFHVMKMAEKQSKCYNFTYEVYPCDLAVVIESVCDIPNDTVPGVHWSFKINGIISKQSVSNYVVQPDDYIILAYGHKVHWHCQLAQETALAILAFAKKLPNSVNFWFFFCCTRLC